MKRDSISVLVVDDNECDALLTKGVLSHASNTSFTVEWAATYRDGLQKLAATPYGVGLIDLHLDEQNGIQFIRVALQAGCKTPLIVLTGLGDLNVDTESIQAGAADYLVKGKFDAELLERVIRHAIDRQRVQAALNEERQRLKTLIDNLPDLIYFKDRSSRFVLCNAPLLKVLGVDSQEQAVGKTDLDFFPVETATQYLADEQRIIATGQALINKEEASLEPSGRTRWILTSKVPLYGPDGSVVGIVGVGRDITALKRVEEELRRARDELEARVRERTAELSQAVAALQEEIAHRQFVEGQLREAIVGLEKHNKAKSEFVANVSHELKTPLTSMMYGTRNLLKGIAGPLPEKAVRYLKMFDVECQRLVGTINDILDLGKLDNKALTVSLMTVPLRRLMLSSIEPLRIQMETGLLELEMAVAPEAAFVKCDPDMIQRVIQNLVSNAIKFTPPPGRIVLRGEAAGDRSGFAMISVTDTGIGIPAEAMHHIAERYYKVGSHANGSGLGLAISKEILHLHGGTLAVTSPPPGRDRGTQVRIHIPLSPPAKVLVVSCDTAERARMEGELASGGYAVETARDAARALERVNAGNQDVVLVDVDPAGGRGLDIVLAIRNSSMHRALPVLALAGPALDENAIAELTRVRVTPVLKPCPASGLIEAIENALLSKMSLPTPRQEKEV